MKSLSLLCIIFTCAVARPGLVPSTSEQYPFGLGESTRITSCDGFNLDLNAQRLVEMEGQAPVWMTELEKVL
jgi:leucyl aminopeptidase